MNEESLEFSGLTRKEAEVYIALLKLGEVPVIEILKTTKDHPQIVYRAIDGLESIGLVRSSYKNHKKYVMAEDPRMIIDIADKKMKALRGCIPDLIAMKRETVESIVRVSKGNAGVVEARIKSVEKSPEGGVVHILGGSGDRYFEVMGSNFLYTEKKRIKKNIIKKMIMYENQRQGWLEHRYDSNEEVRFLPWDYGVLASVTIYNNTVIQMIWSKEPVTIEVENMELAESYRQYFEMLWQMAKP
jgi:predicted transcriptional regulator